MKTNLIKDLLCLKCKNNHFHLIERTYDDIEIREGYLECNNCDQKYKIKNGILNTLTDFMVETIRKERNVHKSKNHLTELEKKLYFTEKYILGLPQKGYHPIIPDLWRKNSENFDFLFSKLIKLNGNERIIDVGTGTCWTSNLFALKGCSVVAIDIDEDIYTGLRSSEIYFANKSSIYFERILGDVCQLPFMNETFDIVFAHSSIHHAYSLETAVLESARVLRKGGTIISVADPVVGIYQFFKSKDKNFKNAVELGVNETRPSLIRWLRAFRKAKLTPRFYFAKSGYDKMQKALIPRWLSNILIYPILILRGGGGNIIAKKKQ